MTKRYIGDAWEDFAQTVLQGHVRLGSVQYIETRRAFYAGATSVLSSLLVAVPEDVTEEESEVVAEAFRAELAEWSERLRKGEA